MKKYLNCLVGIILLSLILPFFQNSHAAVPDAKAASQVNAKIWTCSMHPSIKMPHPGKCPICQMDLIPLEENQGNVSSDRRIELSPDAVRLSEIRTSAVEKAFINDEIPLSGKLDYDQSRFARISAKFPGRVEKLFVNYTGIAVRKNDHLAELFSPELMVLQRELLLIKNSIDKKKSGNAETADLLDLESVRSKMRLWGITAKQVEEIINSGKVSENMVLYSPISGIVIQKDVTEGQYFKSGDSLFTIADVSVLWLNLDVYESDVQILRYGQNLEFSVESFPGRIFKGILAYISPDISIITRTAKVRINVDNSSGLLKPGMFARGLLKVKLDKHGNPVNENLTGKWISPMHPEVIKDAPGKCDVCGMDLVPASSLGYGDASDKREAALSIPDSAVLFTGRRSLVYVRTAPGVFEGREIRLGRHAAGRYIVEEGLREGEEVVSRGNMKIDSELQIRGMKSMMSSSVETLQKAPVSLKESPLDVKDQESVVKTYLAIKSALSADDFAGTVKSSIRLNAVLADSRNELGSVALKLSKAADIKQAREDFYTLTALFYELFKSGGLKVSFPVYRFHCSMAFDGRGAFWFDSKNDVENPYFGAAMLHCGEMEEEIKPAAGGGHLHGK